MKTQEDGLRAENGRIFFLLGLSYYLLLAISMSLLRSILRSFSSYFVIVFTLLCIACIAKLDRRVCAYLSRYPYMLKLFELLAVCWIEYYEIS